MLNLNVIYSSFSCLNKTVQIAIHCYNKVIIFQSDTYTNFKRLFKYNLLPRTLRLRTKTTLVMLAKKGIENKIPLLLSSQKSQLFCMQQLREALKKSKKKYMSKGKRNVWIKQNKALVSINVHCTGIIRKITKNTLSNKALKVFLRNF